MPRISSLLACALLLHGCRPAERRSVSVLDRYPQDWVVDPRVAGPDTPPVGQSLFDAVAGRPVPFPFPVLLKHIESRIGGNVRYRRVLIPLGRSLQRTAASPDFFEYPRAVVAFDADPVKDRLFMGYQEKAGVIEVISYNEAAGRFEFQLVNNYRAGATPNVQYGKRAICTTCHQNHAPIFPRPLWDETNSNSRIAHLLLNQQRSFYGFPKEQSADVPYEIDAAVHRANEFSTYQLLWMQAGAPARAAWLRAMLACRLSGACEFDTTEFAAQIANWRAKWPRGLRIPNPEIPNRNPLAIFSREAPRNQAEMVLLLADRQKNIEPHFEPAAPREPLEIWQLAGDRLQRVMAGLATFFPMKDVVEIDRALLAKQAETVEYRAKCVVTGDRMRCAGDFSMEATLSGEIRRLVVGTQPVVRNLIIKDSVKRGADTRVCGLDTRLEALSPVEHRDESRRSSLRGRATPKVRVSCVDSFISHNLARDNGGTARCGDGNRIERIELHGTKAVLVVRRDFQILAAAIAQLEKTDALAPKPFRPSIVRELLLNQIGF